MPYAQTDIKHGKAEPAESDVITAGSEVNQEDFTEAEWQGLVEAGAISETPIDEPAPTDAPQPEGPSEAPSEAPAEPEVPEETPAEPEPEPAPAEEAPPQEGEAV